MKKKAFSFAQFYQKAGTLLIFVIVFLAATMVTPNFLQAANLTNVLRQITVVAILACGTSFILISGNINIAYDGLIPCIGCISCIIMTITQNLILAIVLPIILGAALGYGYGILVTIFQVPSFIVGMAVNSMAKGAILLITDGKPVSNTGLGNYSVLGQGTLGVIPISVIIMLVVLALSHLILSRTCFGRKVYAVGGNKAAAIASGINSDRVIRIVYLIDGIFCAIGAILFMSRLNSGQPSGGAGYAFDAITAACVGGVSISGGTGGMIGAMIGAAIVGILNNILNLLKVDANWQDVVSGIVILVAVAGDAAVKASSARNMKKKA